MARFMPALHVYWEVRIFPYEFPIVRGVGQVTRGDLTLDGGLGLTGASDGLFKALVARVEPVNKLKPTGGGLDLNEVFGMEPHNRNYLITV